VRPVRVASYNTRDFLDDRDAAASVVRAIDPDVLCLQEVPRRLGAAWRVSRFAGRAAWRGWGVIGAVEGRRSSSPSASASQVPVITDCRCGCSTGLVGMPWRTW